MAGFGNVGFGSGLRVESGLGNLRESHPGNQARAEKNDEIVSGKHYGLPLLFYLNTPQQLSPKTFLFPGLLGFLVGLDRGAG